MSPSRVHISAVLLLSAGSLACDGEPAAGATPNGASVMFLSPAGDGGSRRRPAVAFNHGKHTTALAKEGCEACHLVDAKKRVGPFVTAPPPGADGDELARRYHDKCLGCHKERGVQGKDLPQACGECHDPGQGAGRSSWRAMVFDHSLHQRHVQAVAGEDGAADDTCKTCHHTPDAKLNKLVYRKGAEAACGACHGAKDKDKRPSLRNASHQACISCHQQRGPDAGPVTCEGCHDQSKQVAMHKLKSPPRLVAGQKDMILVHTKGSKAKAVSLDHKLHEQQGVFCTTCHHDTLEPCAKCHTSAEPRDGGGVALAAAHHDPTSQKSCVGCHSQALQEKACAGCHSQRPATPGPQSCATCHSGPLPVGSQALAALPASSDDFPEKIQIKILADKYAPSDFPHRKIVAKLDSLVRGSKLAARFHGDTEALCAGCHHHSPAGTRPPPCKSCHDDTAHPTRDRPSLKVAYHRQCMGCHKQMEIKAQGCTDCHAKKVSP